MSNIITYTIAFILAATPLSLIVLTYINKLFSNSDPRLGSTTTIVTGMRGTLTKEELIVRSIIFDKFKITVPDEEKMVTILNTENEEEILIEKTALQKDETIKLMAESLILCHFDYAKILNIEEILTRFFNTCGFSKHQIKEKYQQIQELKEPQDKKLSTVVVRNMETKEIFSFSKGNAYSLLKKCTRLIHDNHKIELNHKEARKLRKKIDKLNRNGQKVIAFAYKPLPLKQQHTYTEGFAETDMVFIGIIGLTNPLNKKVSENISLIKQAGIKTFILTKEKERKAVAIAKILQIINPQYYESLTGPYIQQLSDQKLDKMLSNREKDYVFSELKEPDKIRIMEILRTQREKIAVAEGNNSLKNIVHGIQKGRLINKNYRKFATHALACKIAEVFLFIAAIITQAPLPLTIAIIILLDLTINLSLELALKSDENDTEVMSPQYHPSNTKFFRKKNFVPGLFKGLIIGLAISTIYFFSLFRDGFTIGQSMNEIGHHKAVTLTFTLLAFIQILNAIYLRHKNQSILTSAPWQNPYLILTSVISIIIIYIFNQLRILNLTKIDSQDWHVIIFLLTIFIIFQETRRHIIRKV